MSHREVAHTQATFSPISTPNSLTWRMKGGDVKCGVTAC